MSKKFQTSFEIVMNSLYNIMTDNNNLDLKLKYIGIDFYNALYN